MPFMNHTVKHSSGADLTGKLWRKDNPSFCDLPFYSNIPRMDEMAESLGVALCHGDGEELFKKLLIVR
jgi:hypothetical protein